VTFPFTRFGASPTAMALCIFAAQAHENSSAANLTLIPQAKMRVNHLYTGFYMFLTQRSRFDQMGKFHRVRLSRKFAMPSNQELLNV
jgi:hypothetical protein